MSADDTTAGPAARAGSFAFPRHEQTFPALTPHEIERMRRFGELRAYSDVETLLIPPDKLRALLVVEADLGERIMRALILRRVSLIQGGPVARPRSATWRACRIFWHATVAGLLEARRPVCAGDRMRATAEGQVDRGGGAARFSRRRLETRAIVGP